MEETFVNTFKETIKNNNNNNNNNNDNVFDACIASEEYRISNELISLEKFIELTPSDKELYEDMRSRHTVSHTYKAWERFAKNSRERFERLKNRSDADIPDIEYYYMFKQIDERAGSLFSRYVKARQTKYVPDKDLQDYVILVIRTTLDEYAGVSHKIDTEAFIETLRLKNDEFEARRLEIFKDVKDTVVEHFEDLGLTLSERNLRSIDWWITHYKVNFTKVN